MLYYRIKDGKLYDYACYKYDTECQETDIITQSELQEHPNKVIVQEVEQEIDVPDEVEEGEEQTYHQETITTYILVLNPDYEQEEAEKERERINMLSLTKREVFLALFDDKGLKPEQLRSQITDERALIEFDYAEKYYRYNPLINAIGAMLGYTPKQLDDLFIYKSFNPPEPEPTEEGE